MQEPFDSGFDALTLAIEVISNVDLIGKTAIITGGSAGLGYETARVLATAGAKIILPVRNRETGKKAAKKLVEATGNSNIAVATLDLSSFASIKNFAKSFLDSEQALDILINNAGIMAAPFALGEYGIESHMQVNYAGPLVLSALLAPALCKQGSARIVTLSSLAHHTENIVFDDINYHSRDYNKWKAYSQSKTASALLAIELHNRLAHKGIVSNAVHPGMITETNLTRHLPQEEFQQISNNSDPSAFKSLSEGAATSVWAATAPALEGNGGNYLENCQVAELIEKPNLNYGVLPYAIDHEAATRLWRITEETIGENFDVQQHT